MTDKNQVKLGLVILNTDDSENFPQAQISYMGKVANIPLLQTYGFTSRPIEGKQSLALIVNVQGQEQNRIAIPFAPLKRKRKLKPGESVMENMKTGAFMYMRDDGTMEISIPKDWLQTCKNITINGEQVTLTATGVTVNAPLVQTSADVKVGAKFGCNGAAPQPPGVIGPLGTQGQINAAVAQIKAILIANGIAQ